MGLFDTFKRKQEAPVSAAALIGQPFPQQYFDECKYIWKQLVPPSGQADTLQGELLREIEQLRSEAQHNGNVNWDEDFDRFCDHITQALSGRPELSQKEQQEIGCILAFFKECGQYAAAYQAGEISEDALDPERLAYTADDLYDRVCDRIGKLQRLHPEPIPYVKNPAIHR